MENLKEIQCQYCTYAKMIDTNKKAKECLCPYCHEPMHEILD